MAIFNFFDLDMSLKEDPNTKDLKDIYNEDAVNQSIDIFITNPYRAGEGLTNRIFDMVFSDIGLDNSDDIALIIEEEFQRGYSLLAFKNIGVIPDVEKKRYQVSLDWFIPKTNISGTYDRYWNQPA